MTTHLPMARVPFAALDNPRLQHLASAKNRQNGIFSQKTAALNGKQDLTKSTNIIINNNNALLSPPAAGNKRAFEPASFDDCDSENVDPAMFGSPSKKKSKSEAFEKSPSSFTFTLTSAKSMPPPSAFPNRILSTPSRSTTMGSPRAPMTAPAGRSPKRKIAGAKGGSRRVSAPYSRIDPPAFGGKSGAGASTLPFSLDAALSGSLTSAVAAPKSAGATIQETMPKNWFFEIYEDTPEEDAANLMEHSTMTLDLSSDDEGNRKERDDRGKENTPPEGYDAPTASRPVAAAAATAAAAAKPVKKTDLVRKKVVASDEMDDGQRSPLSDLETDPFFPEGLDKSSHVVVDGEEGAKPAMDVKGLFAVPPAKKVVEAEAEEKVVDAPVVGREGDVKGEIIVWEDQTC